MRLQWLQLFLTDIMAVVKLNQNIEVSALEIMEDAPWWAAWSAAKQSCRRDGGITTQSL